MSLQYHHHRAEVWTVVSGVGTITINEEIKDFKVGEVAQIPLGVHHRMENKTSEPVVFIEVQHGTYPVDDNGNMVIGTEIFTAFVGLKDSILVYTSDALLILHKEKSQDVKKKYSQLEKYKSTLR